MEPGETREYDVTVEVCAACNAVIGEADLCTYRCAHDGVPLAQRPVVMRRFRRTDVLIEELAREFKRC